MSSISSSTSASGTKRITGLFSTLDVESLVKASLTRETAKLQKYQKNITYSEWKQDAYKNVNKLVTEFTDKYLSLTNRESSVLLSSAMNEKKITLSSDSAVKLTATGSTQVSSFSIDSIERAKSANINSVQMASGFNGSGTKVADLKDSLGVDSSVAGISFTIGEKEFTFDDNTTMSDVMKAVNQDKSLGVTMIYNEFSRKYAILSDATGDNAEINITGANETFKSLFGVGETGSVSVQGSNAKVVIDGTEHSMETNSFTLAGYKFDLLKDTNEAISVTTTTDEDAIYKRISNFISDYNTLISSLDSLISEKKDRNYEPITDDEKEKMTENQIKIWEEKAKKGILAGDSQIKSLLNSMRSAFSGEGLASIGIQTGNYFQSSKGEIVLDETKLKEAISTNLSKVVELFTKASTNTDTSIAYNESGLAGKLKTLNSAYTKNLNKVLLENLSKSIETNQAALKAFQTKFNKKEDALYAKYAALESALSKMNGSTSWMFSE